MAAASTERLYVVAVGLERRRICGTTTNAHRLQRVVHDLNWFLHKRRQLCEEVYHGLQDSERLQRLHMCTKEILHLDPEWAFWDEPLRYEAGTVHSYDTNPPRHGPAGAPVPPPEGETDFDEISLGTIEPLPART